MSIKHNHLANLVTHKPLTPIDLIRCMMLSFHVCLITLSIEI